MPHGQAVALGQLADLEPGASADQRAGGDVPLLDRALEVGVVAPGRGPREIERGAAEAADVAHARHQAREHLAPARARTLGVVGEAGRDHRRRELAVGGAARRVRRHARPREPGRPPPVEHRAARRASAREQLVAVRVIDGAGERARRSSAHGDADDHCGIPNRKLTVPSSGSTTQRRPLAPASSAPLLAEEAVVAGGARASSSRIARSAARSASLTRSVGVLLLDTSRSAPRSDALEQQRARPSRAASTASSSSSPAPSLDSNAGRPALAPSGRSASSCAASESSVRLVVRAAPTSCTQRGRPSAPKPGRHGERRAGR